MVLEKTLESPLDCKEIQLVSPKGNQSWIFIGRTDAGAKTPIEGLHLGDVVNLDDTDGKFLNTIDNIKVFSSENKKAMEQMQKTATKILKGKDWQPLIDMKGDDGEIVKIYQAKEGEKNTNVVVAIEEDECVVVIIDGTFDIKQMMEMGNKGNNEEQN